MGLIYNDTNTGSYNIHAIMLISSWTITLNYEARLFARNPSLEPSHC